MANPLMKIMHLLACPGCRSCGLHPSPDGGIACRGCGKFFPFINGVVSFVPDHLVAYSEVEPEDRDRFLQAKKLAYGGHSLISRMYNHYHRYAARKRMSHGDSPLTVDIGFGIGEHYPFLTDREKREASYIGIDLDRFKLEYFHALHPEVPIVQASASLLPIADGSVDVVQLLAILEHFTPAEMAEVLAESARVLKPSGLLVASYPAEGGRFLRCCQKVMHAFIKCRTGFDLETEKIHHHCSTALSVQAMLLAREELTLADSFYYPFRGTNIDLSLFVNETYVKN